MKTLQKIWQWISKPVAVNLPPEPQQPPALVKQTWFVIYDVEFQRSTGFDIYRTATEAQHVLDSLRPDLAAHYCVQQRELLTWRAARAECQTTTTLWKFQK